MHKDHLLEIENLRAQVRRLEESAGWWGRFAAKETQRADAAERKLGEAVGLLRERRETDGAVVYLQRDEREWAERADTFLSASAEPARPKRSAPLNACGGCEGGYGFLIGHDSSKEEPHSIRCGHCYREVRAKEHADLAGAWNSANPANAVHEPAKGGDGEVQS